MGLLGYTQDEALDSDILALQAALEVREDDRTFEHRVLCYASKVDLPYEPVHRGPKLSLADKWRSFRDAHNAKMLAQQMQNPN